MNVKRVLIYIAIGLLVLGLAIFFFMNQQINKYAKQDFSMINIAGLPDGIYQGSASALLVTARVEVTVRAGQILEVKLLDHNHGPGYGAEAICDNIVKTNSPDVDGISGATASSIVIKAAVLEALKSELAP
ncbi:MAG: FMN-binding protein [Clostridiaceae bacterium]|nr:FMN-binding protein [Clostridiaceae bacterium]